MTKEERRKRREDEQKRFREELDIRNTLSGPSAYPIGTGIDWDSRNRRHIMDLADIRRRLCGRPLGRRTFLGVTIEAAREIFAQGAEEFYCQKCKNVLFDEVEVARRTLQSRLEAAI